MSQRALKNIIYIGLFIVPFIPFLVSSSLFFPFITTKAFAFRIIAEVVFAVWVLLALSEPEFRPRVSWITWALRIFLAVILLADIFGLAPAKSLWSNAERMEGFVALAHLALFYIVTSGVFKETDWKRFWNVSLVASFFMVVYCAFQLLGVLEIHQSGSRVDGTLGNAAYLAVYLLFHIFIALFYMLRTQNRSLRWVYGILAALLAWTLYFTATRGAILGLLGGLLITALLSLRNRESGFMRRFGIVYVAVFLAIILGFFAFKNAAFVKNSPVLSRFSTISVSEWRTEGRAFVWPMALQGIKERPILGWGQDNFNYVFNEHYRAEMFKIEPWFDRAHNIFLDWGIAGGLLGLLAYLSLYVALLWYIWRGAGFSLSERAVLTGLVAAYFFHNLFVFDHLVSYILFFSLLAYVNSRTQAPVLLAGKTAGLGTVKTTAAPLVLIALLVVGYYVNVKPIMANTSLIEALSRYQSGDPAGAVASFKRAYAAARLGRPEIVEQMAAAAPSILADGLSTADQNSFFLFVKSAVEQQAADFPTDARYQLLAGTYLEQTGQSAEALTYLNKAKALVPSKQLVYFELAAVEINQGDTAAGLATLKIAYELAPEDTQAEVSYLVGAIYAKDFATEARLVADLRAKDPASLWSDQIFSAYSATGRYQDLVALLKEKLAALPNDPQNYYNLVATYLKMGDKVAAVAELQFLGEKMPAYKATADNYIKGIQNGSVK